jgi:hypothetical protein
MSRWPCVAAEDRVSLVIIITLQTPQGTFSQHFLFKMRLPHTCTDGAMFDDCGNCFFITL